MAVIHKALDECSAEHPVFYEDEVDIHLNPKIGADWQLRGQQKRVVTPGQNEKYYLAGALHSGTGKVSYVGGNSKSSALFIALLKHLKATYRRAKTITLIVDNYIIHKSRELDTLSFIFAVIAPTIAVRPRFIQYAARIVSIAPKLFTS
jgi:transposase